MYVTFVVGTAGSGKSLLVKNYADWLLSKELSVAKVNLDPGAVVLPYTPDVDVRDYVAVEELMERYGLGPNGALVMAADLMAAKLPELRREVEETGSDYAVVDTPGQMELFAFRPSGPYLARELSKNLKAVVYLFDSSFSSDPLNFVANLFLATAVYLRLLLPQIYVLSKVDLLPRAKVDEILDWAEDEKALEVALNNVLAEEQRLLSHDVLRAIEELGLTFELTPVSAKTFDGFVDLSAQLTRIFSAGEEVPP